MWMWRLSPGRGQSSQITQHLSECSSLLSGTKLRVIYLLTVSDAVETFITQPHGNTDAAKRFSVADEG